MRYKSKNDILRRSYFASLERNLVDSSIVRGARAVRRGPNLSIAVPRKRGGGGRSTSGLRWAILLNASVNEDLFDDYMLCRFYDPLTGEYGTDDITVLKPWHLQRSLYDGQTINYADGSIAVYTYDDNVGGQVRAVSLTPAVGSGAAEEFDEVVRPYYHAGSIFQIMPVPTFAAGATAEATGTFGYGNVTPSTITRASGSFITDAFEVGMTLTVSGTALNDGTYTLATVGATSMTVSEGGLTAETVESTLSGSSQVTAQWMDANLQARFFLQDPLGGEVCLTAGGGLEFDVDGCIGIDLDTGSTVQGTVVTGGSLSRVGDALRLTLTRAIASFPRNAAGVVLGVTFTPTTSITSDISGQECT